MYLHTATSLDQNERAALADPREDAAIADSLTQQSLTVTAPRRSLALHIHGWMRHPQEEAKALTIKMLRMARPTTTVVRQTRRRPVAS